LIQDEAGATYEPPCDDKVAGIDWQKPAQDTYNLIRGCDPQPGAFSVLRGDKVCFYSAKLIAGGGDQAPGTVVGTDDGNICVAVPGGQLVVGKVRTSKHGKVPAAEFAADIGLKVGARFGE
jgi:methionyl-tRNA formyltransferase